MVGQGLPGEGPKLAIAGGGPQGRRLKMLERTKVVDPRHEPNLAVGSIVRLAKDRGAQREQAERAGKQANAKRNKEFNEYLASALGGGGGVGSSNNNRDENGLAASLAGKTELGECSAAVAELRLKQEAQRREAQRRAVRRKRDKRDKRAAQGQAAPPSSPTKQAGGGGPRVIAAAGTKGGRQPALTLDAPELLHVTNSLSPTKSPLKSPNKSPNKRYTLQSLGQTGESRGKKGTGTTAARRNKADKTRKQQPVQRKHKPRLQQKQGPPRRGNLVRTSSASTTDSSIPVGECEYVTAKFAYSPSDPLDMALRASDVIEVYQMSDSGWWFGKNVHLGCKGYFPSNFVEKVKDEDVDQDQDDQDKQDDQDEARAKANSSKQVRPKRDERAGESTTSLPLDVSKAAGRLARGDAAAAFAKGDLVRVKTSVAWIPGKVTRRNADGTFRVELFDGKEQMDAVKPSGLRRDASRQQPGPQSCWASGKDGGNDGGNDSSTAPPALPLEQTLSRADTFERRPSEILRVLLGEDNDSVGSPQLEPLQPLAAGSPPQQGDVATIVAQPVRKLSEAMLDIVGADDGDDDDDLELLRQRAAAVHDMSSVSAEAARQHFLPPIESIPAPAKPELTHMGSSFTSEQLAAFVRQSTDSALNKLIAEMDKSAGDGPR